MEQHTKNLDASNPFEHLKNFLSSLADWLNSDAWGLKVIVLFLPGLWSPVILKLGSRWLTTNDSLNIYGKICVITIYSLALATTLLTTYKSNRDEQRKKLRESDLTALDAEVNLRHTIAVAESTVENIRVRKIVDKAHFLEKKNSVAIKLIEDVFDPKGQINAILDELKTCFSKVTEVTKERIYISAAYSIDAKDGKNWHWLTRLTNPEGTASLDDLLSKPSAFKIVVENKTYFYCNDKTEAAQNGQYYFDNKDRSVNNVGSIICWNIGAQIKGLPHIRMIINISTYGRRLLESESITEELLQTFYEEKIRNIIFQQFENELIENLLLFHLLLLNKPSE